MKADCSEANFEVYVGIFIMLFVCALQSFSKKKTGSRCTEAYNNRSHSLNFGTFKRRSTINLILENKPLINRGKTVQHLALAAETSRKLLLQNPRYSSHSILSYKSQLLEYPKAKSDDEHSDHPKCAGNDGVRSFWDNKFFHYVKYAYEKLRIQKLIPLGILILYTFLGGYVIYCIEEPIEREFLNKRANYLNGLRENLADVLWQAKDYGENADDLLKSQTLNHFRQAVYWYTFTVLFVSGNVSKVSPSDQLINDTVNHLRYYTDQMAERCWEIRMDIKTKEEASRELTTSLALYENLTGVSTTLTKTWTYSNCLFLAITIYTTIGYGSVFPHTNIGRVATILYAICGIPLYLIVVHKMGHLFLAILHNFYNCSLTIGHHLRLIKEPSKFHKTARINFMSGTGRSQSYNVPVSLAIGVTFGWMFACAGLFCLFFETTWDYFTSFYFFFISLTTIGFGDVTPTHPEYMFATSVLIIIGLSLVSMCISVVQLKLEQLFEDMMMSLMEEGDIEAPDLSAVEGGAVGLFQLFNALKKKKKKMAQKGRSGDKSQRGWPSPAFSSFRRSRPPQAPGAAGATAGHPLFLPLMNRRKRNVLIDEWLRKVNRKHVATQTDWRKDLGDEDSSDDDEGATTSLATTRTSKIHNFAQTDASFSTSAFKAATCDRACDVATLTPVFERNTLNRIDSLKRVMVRVGSKQTLMSEATTINENADEDESLSTISDIKSRSRMFAGSRRRDYNFRSRASADEIQIDWPKIVNRVADAERRWSVIDVPTQTDETGIIVSGGPMSGTFLPSFNNTVCSGRKPTGAEITARTAAKLQHHLNKSTSTADNYYRLIRMIRHTKMRQPLVTGTELVQKRRTYDASSSCSRSTSLSPMYNGQISVPCLIPEPQIIKIKTEQMFKSFENQQQIFYEYHNNNNVAKRAYQPASHSSPCRQPGADAQVQQGQMVHHRRQVSSSTTMTSAAAVSSSTMYVQRDPKVPIRVDDFKSLLQEIGCRIDHCRTMIVKPPSPPQPPAPLAQSRVLLRRQSEMKFFDRRDSTVQHDLHGDKV